MSEARDNLTAAALQFACEDRPGVRATHTLVLYADGTAVWVELPEPSPPPPEAPEASERRVADAHLSEPEDREDDAVARAIEDFLEDHGERMTRSQIASRLAEIHHGRRGFSESNVRHKIEDMIADARLIVASKEQGERDTFKKGVGLPMWSTSLKNTEVRGQTGRNDLRTTGRN